MKKLLFAVVFMFMIKMTFAQDSNKVAMDNSCMRDCFSSQLLIENQTTETPMKGSKQLFIFHRFSPIDNPSFSSNQNLTDLFGIYGSSNIKIGLDYGITDRLMVGISTEKASVMQELHWKYAILRQTESGSMPIALSYFGNGVLNAGPDAQYGADYKFINRFSFFHELIISRKFTPWLSIEAAGSYSHFNSVDTNSKNDAFGLTIGGRAKVFGEFSIIFEYDQGFFLGTLPYNQMEPLPNYALGFEIGTSTHTFQVFATTSNQIIQQKNFEYLENQLSNPTLSNLDIYKKTLMIGFNLTVRL